MQFSESQAIYLQIVGFIEEKILMKEWKADERIPSVRDLAMALEVNPNTVVRTYEVLQQQGIIFNKRGIGYFVSENAPDLVLKDRRSQFIERELPVFFKNTTLLGFTMDEIINQFQHYLKTQTQQS